MGSGYDKNNTSAAKRIISAAAMLALSAVMLSTSTYAWFTMNKQVEMTGIAMSATAGEGMEIALASVSGTAITAATAHDSLGDDSWKSAVIVGDYYSKIGKLRPASSVDGVNLYDATNASDGGKKASKFVKIELDTSSTAEDAKKMALLELKSTLTETAEGAEAPKIDTEGRVGYYVDIPVFLRTNKAKGTESEGKIYCKLKIQQRDENGAIVPAPSDNLYKAVRVAFVPSTTGTSSATKIFGVDDKYYNAGQAVSSESGRGSVTVVKDFVADADDFTTGVGAESGLMIPYADSDKYGYLDFVVRIWIEGESEFCSDATSGQSWNIDLQFSLGEFTDTGTNTNP